jgi:hypothetical protein
MTREEWLEFRNGEKPCKIEWLYEWYVKKQEAGKKEIIDIDNFTSIFQHYIQVGNVNRFIKFTDDLFEVSFLNNKEGVTLKYF